MKIGYNRPDPGKAAFDRNIANWAARYELQGAAVELARELCERGLHVGEEVCNVLAPASIGKIFNRGGGIEEIRARIIRAGEIDGHVS